MILEADHHSLCLLFFFLFSSFFFFWQPHNENGERRYCQAGTSITRVRFTVALGEVLEVQLSAPRGPVWGHEHTKERGRKEGGRRREGPLSFSSFKSVSLAAFIGVILPRLWVLVLDACPWRRRRGRRTIQNSHGGTEIIGTAGSGRRLTAQRGSTAA